MSSGGSAFSPRVTPARRDRSGAQGESEPRVLRGEQAAATAAARLDGDLRSGRSRAALTDQAIEEARRGAAAQGYAAGWADGQRTAAAEVRAEAARQAAATEQNQRSQAEALLAGLQGLQAAVAQLENRMAEPMAEAETALATAAVDLAEAILGRELALAADPGLDAVRRALALAPANRPVVVRMNPVEADAVRAIFDSKSADFAIGREISVVPDPSVLAAGCVIECDATRIDAQLGPALQRVWAVLAS